MLGRHPHLAAGRGFHAAVLLLLLLGLHRTVHACMLATARPRACMQVDAHEGQESSDLASLEALLRAPRDANACLKAIRSLVGRHMLAHADEYEPFINGCGPDYTDLSLAAMVQRHVLPLCRDAEQLQVDAMAKVRRDGQDRTGQAEAGCPQAERGPHHTATHRAAPLHGRMHVGMWSVRTCVRARERARKPLHAGCGSLASCGSATLIGCFIEFHGQPPHHACMDPTRERSGPLRPVHACMQALGAVLGVLDCAGSAVGALKHPCAAAPPHCWVVHLPAHYEIIYPRVPTDALDGVPVPLQ